ncbi:hypothetical protein HYDPIDRAFT_114010 [Hydnomerulius pinastri MD-312]|uniref:Cytochrome P450 n=1 Tax=Hydnomerulius pinastri MD-312 TaxID=994086 RepID=A0A0C9WDB4_9AGAM|nr:hypothetical protein HYDPIDRAFT_114010 [Hydnomerulius pinastri MD-312]
MVLDSSALIVCSIVSAIFILSLLKLQRSSNASSLPYPPGPKPLPLLGNVLHLNKSEPWLSYTEWSKKYGEILYVRLLGKDFIILNSEKVARALMGQRSTIYSDRPYMPNTKLCGMEFNTVSLPYGDEWQLHRKLLHHSMRAESTALHYRTYIRKTRHLLVNLLDTPEDFERHFKIYVGSIILSQTYGHETSPVDDPLYGAVEQLTAMLSKALTPVRAVILSTFPIIAHLPPWFPGAGIKRDGVACQKLASEVLNVPFDLVKKNMVEGCAPPSIVSECLSQIDEKAGEQERERLEHAIKSTAATLFLAGSETNSAILHAFVLAMVLYPEVQAKAQAEIDSVIGPSRLPDFKDQLLLPYINAILRELFRWNPVVPLGMPHATSSSDIYDGYFIPKGAYVIPNVWAMSRNTDKYEDVEDFKPERHLTLNDTPALPPPTNDIIFGFGRRICPGRYASEAFLFAAIASILTLFCITRAKDSDGREIPVERKFTSGISVHPVPFPCAFVCRSKDREQFLRTRTIS